MAATAVLALTPTPRGTIPLRSLRLRETTGLSVRTLCSTCNLRELCLPRGLSGQDIVCMDQLIHTRKRMKRGQSLYRDGDPFHSLYVVSTGFFKSNLQLEDGCEQVTGFHMMGELMGMDGIGSGKYNSSAIALEDSEVCALPYAHLVNLSRDMHSLLPRFHQMMSREIVREHGMMLLLGSMRAEQRLVVFLLNLSQRFSTCGYSPSELNLRMSREEISSYLGMKRETVSRLFSKFQGDGLIDVQQRQIRILDVAGLKNRHGVGIAMNAA